MTVDHRIACRHESIHQMPARRINRRTLAKATAAFVAMATAGPYIIDKPTDAQESATQANDWVQPENIGGGAEYLSFESDFTFNAIAPHWPGDTAFPAAVEVQLSNDGQTWSDPVVIGPAHTDAGPEDRDGRIYGDLLFTEDATMVRYRALDADGNVTGIPGLTFTYINAKAGPSINDVSRSTPRPTSARPPIISREEWGATRAYGGADKGTIDWTPSYKTVRHVIIHHSETPSFRDPLVEIRSIHYYHAVTRGWGDIGYNYLVDFMGNVYEGRAGGENVVGGHAFQYANGSAGVCTMGSFTRRTATPEAIAGLTWITAWAARNLDPLARNDFHETPNLPTVCGHRDVVNSTCPGDGLYADLPTIRGAVAEVLAGAKQVLQDPKFSPGQTVQTTVEGGNLRTSPGTGKSIAATVPFGAVMHVVDGPTTTDGHSWYQVNGRRGTGWMSSSILKASTAEPPTGAYKIGDGVEVETDMLNIRAKASIAGSVNATIPRGTQAKVLEGPLPAGGFRWYRLETAYGRGWAVEQYLVPKGTAKPLTKFLVGDAVAVKDRDGLRMRSKPGLGGTHIRSLPYGTSGVVVGAAKLADGISWLEIQTRLGTGWVGEPYLTSADDGPDTESKFERGDTVRIATDVVNLRAAPGTNREVLRTLGNGIVGRVTEPSSAANNMWWVRIDTAYGIGWVAEAFLASVGGDDDDDSGSSRSFSVGDTVYIDTDGINIRSTPGTSGTRVAVLFTNEKAKVVDGPRDADGYVWYKLQSAKGTGWGVSRYLGLGSTDAGSGTRIAVGDTVAVDTDGINLRAEPGLSGSRVTVLYTNATANVVDGPRKVDGYTWYKLRAGNDQGWGVGTYLREVAGASLSAGMKAKVIDGELNLRSEPGTGARVVGVLADAAIVEVIDGPRSANGYAWLRVSSARFGAGWCVARYLVKA
jgi:uncharacterized protein YgiM (DUF1202 family)